MESEMSLALLPINLVLICAFVALVLLLAVGAARLVVSPFGLMILAWVGVMALVVTHHSAPIIINLPAQK